MSCSCNGCASGGWCDNEDTPGPNHYWTAVRVAHGALVDELTRLYPPTCPLVRYQAPQYAAAIVSALESQGLITHD